MRKYQGAAAFSIVQALFQVELNGDEEINNTNLSNYQPGLRSGQSGQL